MTPDPSGAARAPQPLAELLAEVRGELAKTFSSDPNVCFPAASAIEKNAREWLGALVQAVEDQQRVGLCPMCGKPSHSKCNHCGEEFFTYRESLADTNERLAPVVRELKAEVAQLRADGQRLREITDGVVLGDGATEDGCFYCGAEYIGETPFLLHEKGCPIPPERLMMIERLMDGDPPPDSPQGRKLILLTDAQEAYERAALAPPGDAP